jgi:Protein NO VEIN, C-terminal
VGVVDFARGETGKPWTTFEIEAVVGAYFDMLHRVAAGERFTKAEVIRGLRTIVPVRSVGAVEFKFANISAVLREEDRRWLAGYVPRTNYQRDLRESVLARLRRELSVSDEPGDYGESSGTSTLASNLATSDVLVPAPSPGSGRPRGGSRAPIVGSHSDSLRDFKNKELGDRGEEWVTRLERLELMRAGRPDLAERVIWVARDRGDGFGYDVASYRPDGQERLIEVKTTRYAARTPFYITRNEVELSEHRTDVFSLYRVHGWGVDPRVFVLDGAVGKRSTLVPYVFEATPV